MIRLITLLLCLAESALSANYYISSSLGNDANAGTSEGAAWRTLSNATVRAGYAAGDSILLKKGDSFYGPLLVTNAGAPGSPIIFDSYGAGDTRPIIYGDHPEAIWGPATGFPGFYTNSKIAMAANIQYFYDATHGSNYVNKGTRLSATYAAWLGTFTNTYAWGQDNQTRIFYVKAPDASNMVGMHMFDAYVVRASGGYSVIRNLEVSSGGIGLSVGGAGNVVSNNLVHNCNSSGIELFGAWNTEVVSNTVCNSGYTMIYVIHPGGSNLIHFNNLLTNRSIILGNVNLAVQNPELNGIGLLNCTNNLVERNIIRYQSTFIDWYYEQNSEVRYNDCFNGAGGTIDGTGISFHHNLLNVNFAGTGLGAAHHWISGSQIQGNTGPNLIWNNTVLNASGGPATVGTNGNNNIFRNNIFVTENTFAGGSMGLYSTGVDSDYNMFYSTGIPQRWIWNATNLYYTLATLFAASGHEQHSIYTNAQFVASSPITAQELRLLSSSLAVNAGENLVSAGLIVAPVLDYNGVAVPNGMGWDIGAFEYVWPSSAMSGRWGMSGRFSIRQ